MNKDDKNLPKFGKTNKHEINKNSNKHAIK
jgi:hypothetical protein